MAFAGAAAILIAVIVLRLMAGPNGLMPPPTSQIWWLRIDRVTAGLVVGAALALAGAFAQTLLRNPLASPDMIGPSAGAGFAVMLSTYLTSTVAGPLSGPATTSINTGAAVIGAVGVLGLVYLLSQRHGQIEPVQLVLIGVVVSILLGSCSTLLMQLMPDRGLGMMRWTIGALSEETPRAAVIVGAIAVAAAGIGGFLLAPSLDAASLPDEEAASVGVAVRPLRVGLFVGAGILTACAVVIAGPVGFVGLIAPHMVRLIAGSSHRVVIPLSAILGAVIIIAADTAVRLIDLKQGRIPMGVVTALAGGAVFIWMLRSNASNAVGRSP